MNQNFSFSARVCPSLAGDGDTVSPADSMAAVFEAASPLPPEMIAPAWPMRRPGGAVRPARNPTVGFPRPCLASRARKAAASRSAQPPGRATELAEHDDASGRRIRQEHLQRVDELGALHRIPADADSRRLAETFT